MMQKLKSSQYPIVEFDPSHKSVIEPGRNKRDFNFPERCVMTFFGDIVEKYRKIKGTRIVGTTNWETGSVNIYEMDYKGEKIAFFHAWVGAPIAVGVLEFVIAYGVKKIIGCGGCGVLDKSIELGDILVPTSAIRDEGTSYHYLPPSREVHISRNGISAIESVLNRYKLKYKKCKTWTTDAFYRETYNIVELRKSEGCLCVEMECSALSAVAEFRGVTFAQMLYSGDNLDLDVYDERDWQNSISVREKLFLLSLDAVLEL